MSIPLFALLGTTGLVDVGYQFFDNTGTLISSRITASIVECPGSVGVYTVAAPTIPSNAVGVYWNSTGTASAYAHEAFDARMPQTACSTNASLLTSGTGTDQISVSSGLVNITQAAADKVWSTTARALTSGGLANVTAWTVALTGNVTGNISGSVGSVTGAVDILQTAADKAWNTAVRVLSAGTNIVLAKGTGVTGFNDIAAPTGFAAATFPTGTIANTTNITSASGVTLGGTQTFNNTGTWTGGITGNVGGNVTGSVGSINGVTFPAHFNAFAIDVSGFVTFNNSGIATATNITNLQTHGDSTWATATGFALATSWTSGLAADLLAMFASSGVLSTAALANAPGGTAPTVAQIDAQLSGTHGSGSWGSTASGSGANAVTITVTDGTNPVPNATVRFGNGINQFTAVSNGSGVASFSLDNATYTVTLSKSGYSFTPTTLAISTTTAHTYAMEAIVITPPTDPTLCRVYCYSKNPDASAPTLAFSVIPQGRQAPGDTIYTPTAIVANFIAGYAFVDVVRNDSSNNIKQYLVTCPTLRINSLVTLTSSTLDIATLVPPS